MACSKGFPAADIAMDIFNGNSCIIDQDPDGQGQAAQSHDIKVSPIKLKKMIEVMIDRGIDMSTINVLRQLPKNIKTIPLSEQRLKHLLSPLLRSLFSQR